MPTEQKLKNGLIWYRNDLRTEDLESLAEASKNHEKVLAVYCFDPRHYQMTRWGFEKTGKFRAQFLLETISQLRQNLEKLHISLLIYQEKPEEVLSRLVENYDISTIYYQKEWTSEEREVEDTLKAKLKNVSFRSYYQQFLYHPEDIPFEINKIPKIFTEFRKACEKKSEVRQLIPRPDPKPASNLLNETTEIPDLNSLGLQNFESDPRSAFPFKGGENEAKKRISDYFWQSKNLAQYKQTRNGLIGTDYSSKLSAWLANGSISPRQIYHEVKKFEKGETKNQSTYWLIFELIWRDFFKYVSLKHGNAIFRLGGILEKDLRWNQEEEDFKRWVAGETSEDFVNANMKELAATGFMSNRGRQNVNSFLAKELHHDWRKGAAYFENVLIDYDVHSNWGNWMYNSGVGNDPRDRKFNIKSQAERYDPDEEYQELWLKN